MCLRYCGCYAHVCVRVFVDVVRLYFVYTFVKRFRFVRRREWIFRFCGVVVCVCV